MSKHLLPSTLFSEGLCLRQKLLDSLCYCYSIDSVAGHRKGTAVPFTWTESQAKDLSFSWPWNVLQS